jgi:hypothetical protein
MHLIALQLTNVAQPAIFKFNAAKDAKREFEAILKAIGPSNSDSDELLMSAFLVIEDDHGHKRGLYAHRIENAALIDMTRDLASQAEMAVLQARGQAQANRAVAADPALRLATAVAAPFLTS